MGRNFDETEMNKHKRGLLITMVQRRFENHVYDYLNSADISDMDSLDRWLDNALNEYFDECDAIKAYYRDQYDR